MFDKTGTITHGKARVTKAILFVKEAICTSPLFTILVGLAESNSEHPLGKAVVKYARQVCFIGCSVKNNIIAAVCCYKGPG